MSQPKFYALLQTASRSRVWEVLNIEGNATEGAKYAYATVKGYGDKRVLVRVDRLRDTRQEAEAELSAHKAAQMQAQIDKAVKFLRANAPQYLAK